MKDFIAFITTAVSVFALVETKRLFVGMLKQ